MAGNLVSYFIKGDEGSFVFVIQAMLNYASKLLNLPRIKTDGKFGENTEKAVRNFQKSAFLKVDGEVGPNTLKALNVDFSQYRVNGNNHKITWEVQDQFTGIQRYNEETIGDSFCTKPTYDAIYRIGILWNTKYPLYNLQVGDISRLGGGIFRPHAGHRNGVDADFRPAREDRAYQAVSWTQSVYSRTITREILRTVKPFCHFALFNDKELIKEGLCISHAGHDNHIHLRFKQS